MGERSEPGGAAFELLIASARGALTPAAADRLRAAAGRVEDWTATLALARRHRVLPLVARHLAATAGAVPAAVTQELDRERFAIAARALAGARELLHLADAFWAGGVRVLPYKGPVLSVAAYGDLGVREFADLDLIVPGDELARARSILLALGYRSRTGMTRLQEAVIYGGQGHLPFVRPDEPAAPFVELHSRFAAARFPWNPDLQSILRRSGSIELAGARVTVPAREDHLLLLLLHGARHFWEELEWLASTAELLRHGAIDGELLLERARRVGGVRAVLAGLEMTRRVLDAPVPPALAEAAGADPAVGALVAVMTARLYGPPRVRAARATPADYRMCLERRRDRARLVALSAVLPTPREWEVVRLPGPLVALYVPLRLARLLSRHADANGEAA